MKRISKWAQRHPVSARVVIIVSQILIISNSLIAGLLLFIDDWQISGIVMPLLAFGLVLLYSFYPKRGHKSGPLKYSYRRQKLHDFGLVLFTFMVVSVGSNNWLSENFTTEVTTSATATFIVNKQQKKTDRQFKKQLRKQLRAMRKTFKKQKNKKGNKLIRILLTLLIFIGAVSLGSFIALLSCNFYCSGQGGLATLVLVGGVAGIGVLVGMINRKIWYDNPRYAASEK